MEFKLPALRTPADVLAVVPYLLGHRPADSVVVLGLRVRRVVFQVRADLPPPGQAAEVAAHVGRVIARQQVSAVLVIGYGSAAAVTPAVQALRRELRQRGVEVLEALRAADGRYWSYLCNRPTCCPPTGTPYDVSTTIIAASATVAGLSPAESREELVARLAPPAAEVLRTARDAARRARERLCGLTGGRLDGGGLDGGELDGGGRGGGGLDGGDLDGGDLDGGELAGGDVAGGGPVGGLLDGCPMDDGAGRAGRGELPGSRGLPDGGEVGRRAVDDALARFGDGAPLDDDEVAWLALLLTEPEVRDYTWRRVDGDVQLNLDLWSEIVRRVDPALSAAPATLLAFTAWRIGEGALASIALDRALDADATYPLAGLLAEAINEGVPPSRWRELITASPGVEREAARVRRRRGGGRGRGTRSRAGGARRSGP